MKAIIQTKPTIPGLTIQGFLEAARYLVEIGEPELAFRMLSDLQVDRSEAISRKCHMPDILRLDAAAEELVQRLKPIYAQKWMEG